MAERQHAPLPECVAYVPVVKPAAAFTALQGETAAIDNPLAGAAGNATADQVSTPQAAQAAASDAQAQSAAAATAETVPVPAANPAKPTPPLDNPVYVTATDPATVAPPAPPKKRSLFASLFGSTPAQATPLVAPEPRTAEADHPAGLGRPRQQAESSTAR